MFVLDTNVVSELRAGKPLPSATVRRWAATVAADQLYLAAVTVLELERGVLMIERRDARQGRILRSWLLAVIEAFSVRVLPFAAPTALLCAAMHVPNRRSDRDAMIAATAKQHGFTVVTRNIADFAGYGVQLLNPWLTREDL